MKSLELIWKHFASFFNLGERFRIVKKYGDYGSNQDHIYLIEMRELFWWIEQSLEIDFDDALLKLDEVKRRHHLRLKEREIVQ